MLPKFLTQMDKNARRAILIVVAMFALVAVIAMIGKGSLNLGDKQYLNWFENLKNSPSAFALVLLTFVLGAFIGVPQWAMIAGMVAAFGMYWGGTGAWGATLISATINFWMAKYIGAKRLQSSGGNLINRIAGAIRNNGFVTSFAIRIVPTGPFILVNMAAGVSGMKFSHFLAGTAFGIIPKIVIVGLITQNIISDEQSEWIRMGIIGLAIMFVFAMLIARKRLKQFVEVPESDDLLN